MGIGFTPIHRVPFISFDKEELATFRSVHGTNTEISLLFIRAYIALLSDSPISGKPVKLYNAFLKELLQDMRGTIRLLSELGDAILQSCSMHSEDTKTGDFLYEMKNTPIFREYLSFYKTGDPQLLRYILSFLHFGKKLKYTDKSLSEAAFRDWEKIEDEMSLTSFNDTSLRLLRAIVHQLLDVDLDDDVLLPKFGPGYVSEGLLYPFEKFEQLQLDDKLAYCFRENRFGLTRKHGPAVSSVFLKRRGAGLLSSIKFVDKNYKSMRSICMEPNPYMYFQQEVSRWLTDVIHHSLTGRFVDLRDQSRNRHYALCGSFTYSADTLDLSAASDRVHVELVKAVFPTKILYFLLGTRSAVVKLPNGQTRRVNKFAPMGSALCFPVQSILFTAITLLGYYDQVAADTGESSVYDIPLKKFLKRYTHMRPEEVHKSLLAPVVYGDDIICDTRTTDYTRFRMEEFGLVVNAQKSFCGSQNVRESCGIYAYEGQDITPVLFRVKGGRNSLPKFYESMISCINHLGDIGYHRTQSLLIFQLKLVFQENVPWLTDLIWFTECVTDPGIFSHCVRRSETRWHPDYQRDEKEVLDIIGIRSTKVVDELYQYDQWNRSTLKDSSTEYTNSVSKRVPTATGFKRRWIPA